MNHDSSQSPWRPGPEAWSHFVKRHPELGYPSGKWGFHNFLRNNRQALIQSDSIRLAKNRFWIANLERFSQVAFDLATGIAALEGATPKPKIQEGR